MKPTAWLAIAGCLAGMSSISCRKKSEPSDLPTAPLAQVTPDVKNEPEPSVEVIDFTPPPAEPPAPEAMPDEEEPSAPDNEAAPE
jgi:hypothetical protein